MPKFEIELGGLITINVGDSFTEEADTLEEAIEKAKKDFRKSLENEYGYVDLDDFSVDYTSELED